MGGREQVETLKAALTDVIGKKDIPALASSYEEGARLLPPGAPVVQGRDKIEARFNAFIDTVETMDMQFKVIDVIDAGDVVVDISHIVASVKLRSGETHSANDKHIVVWRKQADGSFKIAAEAINRDAPGR